MESMVCLLARDLAQAVKQKQVGVREQAGAAYLRTVGFSEVQVTVLDEVVPHTPQQIQGNQNRNVDVEKIRPPV